MNAYIFKVIILKCTISFNSSALVLASCSASVVFLSGFVSASVIDVVRRVVSVPVEVPESAQFASEVSFGVLSTVIYVLVDVEPQDEMLFWVA